ncbi:MAG: hypothetical protein AAFW87_02215 [Pseudomonadota bacterium]
MTVFKLIALVPVVGLLSACDEFGDKQDKTVDRGFDSKHISNLQAGIWVDPNGCDHWIIDDGVEGYLSARLDKYGKPVCSGTAPPTIATGPFKEGSDFPDSI